jgi:Mg-chelatase subunit ChlD
MTPDEIIKMAKEACDSDKVDAWHNGFWTLTQEELERFAELVAAHEREACANLLLNVDLSSMDADHRLQSWTATVLLNFSDAIRARGEQ